MKHGTMMFALLTAAALSLPVTVQSQEPENAPAPTHGKFLAGVNVGGLQMVGDGSDNAKFGMIFTGKLGYEVMPQLTVGVESGYGWIGNSDNDDIKVKCIPIVANATYDFNTLVKSTLVHPYFGVGAGAYMLRLENDGNLMSIDGTEQKTTSFGLEGVLGVNYVIPTAPIGIDVHGKYAHIFSDNDEVGLKSHDWNTINVGIGLTYYFGK